MASLHIALRYLERRSLLEFHSIDIFYPPSGILDEDTPEPWFVSSFCHIISGVSILFRRRF
jgi:hypothetical protein